MQDDFGTSTLFNCQYSPDEWGKHTVTRKSATENWMLSADVSQQDLLF